MNTTARAIRDALDKFIALNPEANGEVEVLVTPDDTKISDVYEHSARLGDEWVTMNRDGRNWLVLSHE